MFKGKYADRYVNKIFRPVVLPYLAVHPGMVLLWDNCTPLVLQEIPCSKTMFYHYSTLDDLLDPRVGNVRLFYRPTVVTLDTESSNQYCVFSFEQ